MFAGVGKAGSVNAALQAAWILARDYNYSWLKAALHNHWKAQQEAVLKSAPEFRASLG